MPMSPRLLRPRSSGVHPEAASWRTRVVANGGTVSTATVQAVDRFCRSIDANGLRSLLWRVNLMAGDNLSAALVPLYRATSSSGAVQGNTTDTNSNFVSGDYVATSGLLGNGSNKALDTGLPGNFRDGRHLGVVPFAFGTNAFRYYIGTRDGGTTANAHLWAIYAANASGNVGAYSYSDAAAVSGSDGGAGVVKRLVISNNFASATGTTLFSDGVQFANTSFGFNTTATTPVGVFAVRQANGTFFNFLNTRLSGYTIGENMTAAQVATYNTIWTTLLTALGRA